MGFASLAVHALGHIDRAGTGIDGQHRVQQHAEHIALADLAKAAPVVAGRRELDIAGVLDRQYVAITNGAARLLAPAFDKLLLGYALIGDKPPEAHLLRPGATGKPSGADRSHAYRSTEQRRPPLSRRRSPNRPSDQLRSARISQYLQPNQPSTRES